MLGEDDGHYCIPEDPALIALEAKGTSTLNLSASSEVEVRVALGSDMKSYGERMKSVILLIDMIRQVNYLRRHGTYEIHETVGTLKSEMALIAP